MNNNSSSGGIGFFSVLTIVFIALKLTDNIDWSWWWVLAPTWMPITLALSIIFVVFAIKVFIKSRD